MMYPAPVDQAWRLLAVLSAARHGAIAAVSMSLAIVQRSASAQPVAATTDGLLDMELEER